MSDHQAHQTPILDLLRDVPADARMVYEVHPTHHQSIPVGVLATQAADEIERLTAEVTAIAIENGKLMDQIERLTAERDEARAERDALAKDAERYRFLSCKGVPPYFHRCSRWRLEYWNGEWWDPLMKEELDAAIDAQIEQERSDG